MNKPNRNNFYVLFIYLVVWFLFPVWLTWYSLCSSILYWTCQRSPASASSAEILVFIISHVLSERGAENVVLW